MRFCQLNVFSFAREHINHYTQIGNIINLIWLMLLRSRSYQLFETEIYRDYDNSFFCNSEALSELINKEILYFKIVPASSVKDVTTRNSCPQ